MSLCLKYKYHVSKSELTLLEDQYFSIVNKYSPLQIFRYLLLIPQNPLKNKIRSLSFEEKILFVKDGRNRTFLKAMFSSFQQLDKKILVNALANLPHPPEPQLKTLLQLSYMKSILSDDFYNKLIKQEIELFRSLLPGFNTKIKLTREEDQTLSNFLETVKEKIKNWSLNLVSKILKEEVSQKIKSKLNQTFFETLYQLDAIGKIESKDALLYLLSYQEGVRNDPDFYNFFSFGKIPQIFEEDGKFEFFENTVHYLSSSKKSAFDSFLKKYKSLKELPERKFLKKLETNTYLFFITMFLSLGPIVLEKQSPSTFDTIFLATSSVLMGASYILHKNGTPLSSHINSIKGTRDREYFLMKLEVFNSLNLNQLKDLKASISKKYPMWIMVNDKRAFQNLNFFKPSQKTGEFIELNEKYLLKEINKK